MALLKFVGSWFLAMAALAFVNDMTRGLAPGPPFSFLSMRGLWQMLHEGSLTALQGAVERSVHTLAWDPAVMAILKLPAWVVLASIGAALCYLGRRRRRVEIYSN